MSKTLLSAVGFYFISLSVYSQDVAYKNFIASEAKHLATMQAYKASGAGSNINVVYQRCNWRINPDSALKGIKGNITTYFKSTISNVNQITFDMNATALSVDSIKFRGAKLTGYSGSGYLLTIPLGVTLLLDKLDSITIFYKGVPPNPTGNKIGFVKTVNSVSSTNVIFTVSESFEARDWWPCKSDLNDKIDSIDIIINTPAAFKGASNGVLFSTVASGTDLIYTWKHRYPIPAYLVCVGVGKYVQLNSAPVTLGSATFPVYHWVFSRANYTALQSNLNYTSQLITAFSAKFGDYPYKNEKYGHYEMEGNGGMEHATFSGMEASALTSFSVVAHELGHQWFGDKVTCSTWNDIWLQEGFATYIEILAAELFSNQTTISSKRLSTKTSARSTTLGPYLTTANNDDDIFGSGSSRIYQRGAMVLSMLRVLLGDTKFFQACTNYLNDPLLAYKTAATADLKAHMEAVSGLDLTGFFNNWVTGSGNCNYTANWSKNNKKLYIQLVQNASGGTVAHFDMPVIIKVLGPVSGTDTTLIIYDKSGTISPVINGVRGSTTTNTISFDLSFVPSNIQFDPENLTMANGTVVLNSTLAVNEILFEGKNFGYYNKLYFAAPAQMSLTGYLLERSSTGVSFLPTAIINKDESGNGKTQYQFIDNVLNGQSYFYRIKFTSPSGATSYSNIIKLTTNKSASFRLMNNPVLDGHLLLSVPASNKNGKIEIIDSKGSLVAAKFINNTVNQLITLEINKLNTGYYLVRYIDDSGLTFIEKFMKGR